jgi:predicted nucleic acid-binding protein
VTVYDAGVLVSADRSERRTWLDHEARLRRGVVPITTAPIVGQVSRSDRQVQLRRLLRGCRVVPFAAEDAHAVGALAGAAASSDVVDAHLVLVAHHHGTGVLTSDPDDLRALAAVLPESVDVRSL